MFAKRNSATTNPTTEATTADAPAVVADAVPPVAEQATAAPATDHPIWTDTDETAYVLMLARRKAAKAKRPTGAPCGAARRYPATTRRQQSRIACRRATSCSSDFTNYSAALTTERGWLSPKNGWTETASAIRRHGNPLKPRGVQR